MTQEELKKILELHEVWLRGDGEIGERADLSFANLSGADLLLKTPKTSLKTTNCYLEQHSNLNRALGIGGLPKK